MRAMRFLAVLVALPSVVSQAQESTPRFEVASIKRNVAGAPGFGGPTTSEITPTGIRAVNSTLLMLVRQAYGIEGVPFDDEYVTGGPGWIRSDRFDVTATAGREVARDQALVMLRTLLAERFKLVVATEQRLRDAYTLRLARSDGRVGPDLRKAADDCLEKREPDALKRAAAMPRPSNGARPYFGTTCAPIAAVAGVVGKALAAPVVDETGLTGRWDIAIAQNGGLQPRTVKGVDGIEELPSIFTVLEDQLWLKVERRREQAPYDVLVIKSVELPSEN